MTADENRPFPTPGTLGSATQPEGFAESTTQAGTPPAQGADTPPQTGGTAPGAQPHASTPPPRTPHDAPPHGAPRVAPPPPEKVRRVGTLTMGFSLIAAGVLALLFLVFPQLDLVFVLRLSPIILVLLGVEIVVNAILFRGQKLKYDLLSGFVCLILIMGSLFAAAIPQFYNEWGPGRHEMERSIEKSTDTLFAEQLGSATLIQSLNTDVYLQRTDFTYKQNATYADILPSDHFSVNVLVKGDYKDRESFAAACRTVLDSLQAVPLELDGVTLRTYGTGEKSVGYELTVDNPFLWKQDAVSLATLVSHFESEWQRLDNERQSLYDEIQGEREELNQQVASEREALSSERQSLYDEIQNEREELNQQLASEREMLSSERQSLYDELASERSAG